MKNRKAVFYGKVELIPGIFSDGYVLDDDSAVMSERGTAKLLGIDQKRLNRVAVNWPPKTIEPFVDKTQGMRSNSIKVTANNSPYQGRNIIVYNAEFIESFIRGYALALAGDKLRSNQIHIGYRAVLLISSLAETTLYTAIEESCGLSPNIQTTIKQVILTMKEYGLTCSIDGKIAIKQDITKFCEVSTGVLNGYLNKHRHDIEAIKLSRPTILESGFNAPRMNGYCLEDVAKIVLNMKSKVGKELKQQVFGEIISFAKPETKGEIEWQKILTKVFAGFSFHHNYPVGKYRADFLIKELGLALECNGFDNHATYDQQKESEREMFVNQRYNLVRFNHLINWEALANGILHAKQNKLIKLYNVGYDDISQPVKEPEATHYGKLELILGVKCDAYILDDNTAVMSERGLANLLGVDHMHLNSVATNWPPKELKPFIGKAQGMRSNSVKVTAKNSPHKGRYITVYDSKFIESLMRAYALAFVHGKLRKNQKHIGQRCVFLLVALVRTALEAAIKQSCGMSVNIQKLAQKHYNMIQLLEESGFIASIDGKIAIKQDIFEFIKVPKSTLDSHLRSHKIDPIKLDYATIKQAGLKATRLNGYAMEDVGKIVLGIDSIVGLELKQKVFGEVEDLLEIDWQEALPKVFEGFNLQQNYVVGKYTVDYFVEELQLVLELCQSKDKQKEQYINQHYGVVKFESNVDWERLLNGMLHARIGKMVCL